MRSGMRGGAGELLRLYREITNWFLTEFQLARIQEVILRLLLTDWIPTEHEKNNIGRQWKFKFPCFLPKVVNLAGKKNFQNWLKMKKNNILSKLVGNEHSNSHAPSLRWSIQQTFNFSYRLIIDQKWKIYILSKLVSNWSIMKNQNFRFCA